MSTAFRERVARHVVVLCHPGPDSFSHSIARAYCDTVRWAGQVVELRDLYEMGFDPVLKATERPGPSHPHPLRDVADELDIIRRSDVFVLVYPIWFGSAPAMLKGYVDRVLGAGVAPQAVQEGAPTSLLGEKRLISFTTSAARGVWLDEQGQQSALRTVFDDYLVHAFGMRSQQHVHFDHITDALTDCSAGQHLQIVKDEAQRLCAQVAAEAHIPDRSPPHVKSISR